MAAFTVRELIESRASNDQIGERGTVRVFQVDATQDLALTADALPKLSDKLPWDTGQIVTARSADREGNSVATSRVMVRYSSSGKWGGINPADVTYRGWKIGIRRIAQAIPYAIRNPYQYQYTDDQQVTQFITSYPIHQDLHPETRERYVRQVRINAFDVSTVVNTIRNQTNKLHKIYGLWYLFEAPDIEEVARNVWDVQYSWEFDTGTPDVFTDTADMVFPHILTPSWIANPIYYPEATMARPPYHQVATIPILNTTTNRPFWPQFVGNCAYDRFFPSGYLGFPGFSL